MRLQRGAHVEYDRRANVDTLILRRMNSPIGPKNLGAYRWQGVLHKDVEHGAGNSSQKHDDALTCSTRR